MVSLPDAFADPTEADFIQFEANAALWRLEVSAQVIKLTEDLAVGVVSPKLQEAARTTLEGVTFELDRLKSFGKQRAPLSSAGVLRLAEVGLTLETARRLLNKAIVAAEQ
jgi:hypothetical protein